MSDEIAQVVEQDVARPMLKAVEDIGETVPTHFEGIGSRLEGAATAHLENESGIVSSIEGVSPAAVESESAGAAESGMGGAVSGSGAGSQPLGEGGALGDAQPPGGQGASDDPVDLVTGVMYLPQRDMVPPGVLALVLERTHRSDYRSNAATPCTFPRSDTRDLPAAGRAQRPQRQPDHPDPRRRGRTHRPLPHRRLPPEPRRGPRPGVGCRPPPEGNDPIGGYRDWAQGDTTLSPGSEVHITAGHHRTAMIANRVQAGEIDPNTLIEFVRGDL